MPDLPPFGHAALDAATTTTGPPPLLGSATAEQYRHAVTRGAERVASRLAEVDAPFTGASPDDLRAAIAGIDLDAPLGDVDAALDEVERIYLRDAVYFHHPRYLAHLNCPVAIPALLAEAILSPINSSLDTWDQSAGGTLIERRLIDWTAARIGLGAAADGVFTSGGTQSNLQALHIARDEACARLLAADPHAVAGPELHRRLRVLVSEIGHFSITKAAEVLGLGEDAVISVPCDDGMRMRPDALRTALDACRDTGLEPAAVVATAGTTDFGSIDPLAEVADACRSAGVWMHVDAAYGCGLLVSRRRHLLAGLERADSVTVDFHKSFFHPISSSAVVVRDRATLRHVTHHAEYLNPESSAARGVPNQVDKSLQTTRRFDALKLWLTLRILGADGVGELFDRVIDLAADAWALLDDDPRFEVVVQPALSTLVFRYVPSEPVSPELCDRANLHAREALLADGDAVVATTKADGRRYLKFTLLNPQTTIEDVGGVLDLVARHAGRFLAEAAPRFSRPRVPDAGAA
jgi:L-2,4-diaminobutyrate decarboxylase